LASRDAGGGVDVKVFISWSDDLSKAVAISLRSWLPMVLQSVKPYMSAEDIPLGARWSVDLSGSLLDTAFGILCVTKGNIDTPWVNYEAGALSKTVADKTRVVPMLIDLIPPLPAGPLAQFQAGTFTKPDVLKMLKAINAVLPEQLHENVLASQLEKWWPDLDNEVSRAKTSISPGPVPTVPTPTEQILQEILELVRQLTRARATTINLAAGAGKSSIIAAISALERSRRDSVVLENIGTPSADLLAEIDADLRAHGVVPMRPLIAGGNLTVAWETPDYIISSDRIAKSLTRFGFKVTKSDHIPIAP